ncbi:exonuclease domain-containing protein [Candidatus Halocynthiibacter alkanivorans]|uniref:exonuclease domain-containing protein n=1 Tax=Candidatus Halocynthiibacter alkanivorans TaxID=2267619 RepID=UPI000DF3FB54|nr:exonuclease domain-containing protein [Candidatus Halocynthiibacter alkanivorans]
MDFIVLDVETANGHQGSICSIGAVRFRGGEVDAEFYTLCNPQCSFSNSWLHGIRATDVAAEPLLEDALEMLAAFVRDEARIVSHMPFDMVAIRKASEDVGVPEPTWAWYDSARVVRAVWEERRKRGYGLKAISEALGIEFAHHNALEDARAAGLVMVAAFERWQGADAALWGQISNDAARRKAAVAPRARVAR